MLPEGPQVFRRILYEILPRTDSELIDQRSQMTYPWPAVHGFRR